MILCIYLYDFWHSDWTLPTQASCDSKVMSSISELTFLRSSRLSGSFPAHDAAPFRSQSRFGQLAGS